MMETLKEFGSLDQTNRENKLPMERVLYEVKKVIVGQDHLLEQL